MIYIPFGNGYFSPMDTGSLQTFLTVAEKQSFSEAAESLYLTQPAVSKRIAALEDELKTRLFDRIGRKISLTEAGRALLAHAKNILLEMEDSKREIANLSGTVAGRLTIGTSHHIGLHRLPPILRKYSADYPEVELDLHFMDSEVACRAVLGGDLELGIVTLPPTPLPDLYSEVIWPDPLVFVVGRDHPLAKESKVSLQRMAGYAAILPSKGTYTRELLEQNFAPAGLALQVGMSTNYLETIKMMVSVGLGWSVLPASMLSPELATIPMTKITIARQLGVVHHQARTLSNAARAMIKTLQAIKATN
jgi:DNA-binding transcriptional LysR family regulator